MNDPQPLVQDRLSRNSWGFLGSQGHILGMDVGGNNLRVALIDLQNHTYHCAQRETTSTTADGLMADSINVGHALLAEHGVTPAQLMRVGVGFGGPVDSQRGVALRSHRMPGWEQFPLKDRVEAAFGATTLVDNDANLIALAEATFGSGSEVQQLFYLHLSSGVGGGLVLDGRLFRGATGTAGEIGHAPVGPIDPAHPNQQPHTLEQHLSISGLLTRAGELGFHTDALSDVFGDHPIGRQVVTEATDLLAVRLAQIVALIDPQMIVLGGVVARTGGDAFVSAVKQRMQQSLAALSERQVAVVASVLGFESVAIGGLALALESMRD